MMELRKEPKLHTELLRTLAGVRTGQQYEVVIVPLERFLEK
jgi:hypothetical protein